MNRLLLLVGTAQGWALWGLWNARELKAWPATDALAERTLFYVALAVPLALYLTQNVAALTRRRRLLMVAALGILFALLGACSAWGESPLARATFSPGPARAADLFAAGILGFILIPLWAHFDVAARRWSYSALFETAWRNTLMLCSSAALTGVFWIVLFAGAMLMKSIGIEFVLKLIEKPVFAIPATGIVFGAAFALGLARVEMILALRRFWLSISAWLLPLLLLFSLMWAVALPFTGLDPFLETHNAALILLWFLALSINFANAAYQDGSGEQPYGARLGRLLEYAWLSLLVLVGVAWWAMSLRIGQHGWSEERVWGIFVLLLATLYTAGYAWSVRHRGGWLANMGRTNIAAALIMALGLALLLTPLADARRIAVHSQMNRLMAGVVDADSIDYNYLRWRSGRYGLDALNELATGVAHKDKDLIAAKAAQTLAQQNRYGTTEGAEMLTLDQLRQRIKVLPQGRPLDDALLAAMKATNNWQQKRCLATDVHCVVWLQDLNGDGHADAVVVVDKPEWESNVATFYVQRPDGKYEYGGTIAFGTGPDKKLHAQVLADIEQGKVQVVAPRYNDLRIGGRRIGVVPAPCGSACKD
jgi:hypothetical protein